MSKSIWVLADWLLVILGSSLIFIIPLFMAGHFRSRIEAQLVGIAAFSIFFVLIYPLYLALRHHRTTGRK